MVAVTFLATVAVVSGLAYTQAMRAMVTSRNRSVAARLAQDKFENLRGLSYTSLMVTTQDDLDVTPPGVDQTYYPPETIAMGGRTFTRSTIVSRVYRDGSGSLVLLSPNAADTGLKQIKVIVQYPIGRQTETRNFTALVSDPGLIPLDAIVYGMVRSTSGAGIANARVFVTQNQNWFAVTSSSGYYQVLMDTRTYTLTASKSGYFDKDSSSITPVGTYNLDFELTAKLTGKVAGIVTARPPHLRISAVFAGSADDGNSHFLELYNPTTAAILITDGTTPQIALKRITPGNAVNDITLSFPDSQSHSVPALGYYLIARDSPTINGVSPDARFQSPQNPFQDHHKGGVALQNVFGVALDTVGWTDDHGDPGPSRGIETTGFYVGGSVFGANGMLLRKTYPSGVAAGQGNSYDRGDNSFDMVLQTSVGAGYPRNSRSAAANAAYGIPASSASMLATDGYSSAVAASATGYYLLANISTGTWSIAGYWTDYSSTTPGTILVVSTGVRSLDLLLETAVSAQGGVAGTIRRSDTLVPLAGIGVSAGVSSTLTDAAGNYILSLESGPYTVLANDGFADISYNTLQSTAVARSGFMAAGVNFNLVPSGVVTGKITTNGTDAYPGVLVHAECMGLEVASDITNSLGNYSLYGVTAGPAIVEPILDAASQAASPAARSLTVTQGTTHSGNDFTVTTSLGKITGAVRSGGAALTTGVLVVASTTSVVPLPTVDSGFRSGSVVLYSAVSDTAGNYTVNVVRNATYTVYGYWPVLGAGTTVDVKSVVIPTVFVSTTTRKDIQW